MHSIECVMFYIFNCVMCCVYVPRHIVYFVIRSLCHVLYFSYVLHLLRHICIFWAFFFYSMHTVLWALFSIPCIMLCIFSHIYNFMRHVMHFQTFSFHLSCVVLWVTVFLYHVSCFVFPAVFFIPYAIMLFFVGMPIFFMELTLGQFSGNSALTCWDFAPIFKGMVHFLPPGVACTTGLSHNPFTWRPL